jgi:hypothetical protein
MSSVHRKTEDRKNNLCYNYFTIICDQCVSQNSLLSYMLLKEVKIYGTL